MLKNKLASTSWDVAVLKCNFWVSGEAPGPRRIGVRISAEIISFLEGGIGEEVRVGEVMWVRCLGVPTLTRSLRPRGADAAHVFVTISRPFTVHRRFRKKKACNFFSN